MKNETLRNIIFNHNNIAPDNLEIIDNNGGSNYLYLAISYHIYNNYNHHRNIRYLIANKLIQKAQEMPMVTINNNLGENIPILEYSNSIFKDIEWSGDAEISMIPLIYDDIRVATFKLILNLTNNNIMGYQFINCYGIMKDINTSILILVNINNNHWTTAFFNDKNRQPINNYIIQPISITNNKNELEKNIKEINNYLEDSNVIKIKKEYNEFLNEINNLNNKTIEEECKFYNN